MTSALRCPVLERPPAVVDTETTGLDPLRDRFVEVASPVLAPGAKPVRYLHLLGRGVPIPEAASIVHDIADSMVAGKRTFAAIGPASPSCSRGPNWPT